AGQDTSDSKGKRILKFIFYPIIAGFALIGFLTIAIPTLILILILTSQPESDRDKTKTPTVEKPIPPLFLELDLTGEMADETPSLEEQIINRIFGGPKQIYMSRLRTALRRAAKDDDVTGV